MRERERERGRRKGGREVINVGNSVFLISFIHLHYKNADSFSLLSQQQDGKSDGEVRKRVNRR